MFHSHDSSNWWGRHPFAENQSAFWRIGSLHLWIQNRPHEWHFSWIHAATNLDASTQSDYGQSIPPGAEQVRFASQTPWNELQFSPSLANRPVVTRLKTPLSVLPGENPVLYISTPLWLRIETAQPSKTMCEFPTDRPSDTWFGPSTTVGELCYASATPAYVNLRDVPFRLHRVITAVMIKNLGDDPLMIERLNLPLPRLSLFYSPRSGFWTDMVTLERKESIELASLRLERQPPSEASPTQFVAAPRVVSTETNYVHRAFSVLFRNK